MRGFLNIGKKKTSGRIVIPFAQTGGKGILKKYNGHAQKFISFYL